MHSTPMGRGRSAPRDHLFGKTLVTDRETIHKGPNCPQASATSCTIHQLPAASLKSVPADLSEIPFYLEVIDTTQGNAESA